MKLVILKLSFILIFVVQEAAALALQLTLLKMSLKH